MCNPSIRVPVVIHLQPAAIATETGWRIGRYKGSSAARKPVRARSKSHGADLSRFLQSELMRGASLSTGSNCRTFSLRRPLDPERKDKLPMPFLSPGNICLPPFVRAALTVPNSGRPATTRSRANVCGNCIGIGIVSLVLVPKILSTPKGSFDLHPGLLVCLTSGSFRLSLLRDSQGI